MNEKRKNLSAAEALETLILGNARFTNGLKSVETFLSVTRSKNLAKTGQWPFCLVLTCSDSRVPIELVFDKGMGDLFVIRSFGTVVDPFVCASMEYAILNFNINLILIMGHSRQGAIRLTMENECTEDFSHMKFLEKTIRKILPSVKRAREKEDCSAALVRGSLQWERIFQGACVENVLQSKAELVDSSKIIAEKVNAGELSIVPSIYELDSGRLKLFIDHKLMSQMNVKDIGQEGKNYAKTAEKIIRESVDTGAGSISDSSQRKPRAKRIS